MENPDILSAQANARRRNAFGSPTDQVFKPLKKVRIKEPIQFTIEQMPPKVHFSFNLDQNKEQALLGSYYEIDITLQPQEDIVIETIDLQIEGIEVEQTVIQGGELLVDNNLMQSQQIDDTSTLNSSMMSTSTINRNITVLRNPQQSPDTGVIGESILPFVSRAT